MLPLALFMQGLPCSRYKNDIALPFKLSFLHHEVGTSITYLTYKVHSLPLTSISAPFCRRRELRQRFRGLTFLVIPFLAELFALSLPPKKEIPTSGILAIWHCDTVSLA